MTDVLVRRCTLSIVRQGGWSWGATPESLVKAAIEALERAIEASLPADGALDADLVVREPLQITLRAGRAGRGLDRGVFVADLPRSLAAALAAAEPAEGRDLDARVPDVRAGPAAQAAPAAAVAGGSRGTPLALLRRLHHVGRLGCVLSLLDEATLAAWAQHLIGAREAAEGHDEPRAVALTASLQDLAATAADRVRLLRALLTAVAAASASGVPQRAVASALAAALPPATASPDAGPPGPGPATDGSGRSASASSGRASGRAQPPATSSVAHNGRRGPLRGASASRPAGQRARLTDRTRRSGATVVRALPFLTLCALAGFGYHEALGATLAAAELEALAPVWATALAYKLLEPPGRGWLRDPASRAAATAFAGSEVESGELLMLAAAAPRLVGPADALVAAVLIEGRDACDPLLVRRTPGGDVGLVDRDGLFVLALGEDAAEVDRVVQAAGRPPLLRPRRGRAQLARLDAMLEAFEARCAVPLAPDATLERSLSLAAMLALGTIAWELWPAHVPSDALLTLERMGDIEARVEWEPGSVRVKLPLGRRHRELYEHGLLVDVAEVPWFGNRVLEVTGG